MKKHRLLTFVVAFGWLSAMVLPWVCQAAEGEGDNGKTLKPPTIFQAAGLTIESI